MEIKLISKDKKNERVTFLLSKSTPAFANALRRLMMEKVPTIAIEDVEFRKNSSVLYDEIIAHRLGLIPLKTDLKSYDLQADCTCKGEGCAKCTLKLTLSVKGPALVLASDIKSKDPKVIPVFPNTPIVKLLKGQELEFEATAVLGKGEMHSKWSPALAWYRYKPEIIVDQAKVKDNVKKIVSECPSGVFEFKNNKLEVDEKILMEDPLAAEQAGAAAEKFGGIRLNESDTAFIFTIESWGQLSAKEIVSEALDIFDSQLTEFDKALE